MIPCLRRRRGFTLIELMVVIAIIAILAAILFPVFAQAREAARAGTCAANLHQLGIALQMYARDHDGEYPPQTAGLPALVIPYVNGLAVFYCPSDAIAGSSFKMEEVTPPLAPNRPRSPGLIRVDGAGYSSYQYRGGLTVRDRGDTPVAGDWQFRHEDAAQVLYLSGEVKRVLKEHWKPFALEDSVAAPSARGASPRPTRTEHDVTPFLPSPVPAARGKAPSASGGTGATTRGGQA